jgi:MoaA/NifB/PqqE/SkfB family radical SAM enzyme
MTAATAGSSLPSPDVAAAGPTERTFSLGLGLTNECNLSCSFCYRDTERVDRLGPDQVRAVLDSLPVRSVNLGTGENGMHPQFGSMLELLRGEPIKLTITSNGHSIAVLGDDEVRAFADVEFSIDYPSEAEQDAQRGPGNWKLVMEQAARCRRLGVGVTFIAVMMRTNFDRLHEIAAVAARFDAPLRINVYQAVRTDTFALTYEDIVESRPFADARLVPEACRPCAYREPCGGGCAGRRRLLGELGSPDPYCPIIRGEERPLSIRMAPTRELPKLESACTTIVQARV